MHPHFTFFGITAQLRLQESYQKKLYDELAPYKTEGAYEIEITDAFDSSNLKPIATNPAQHFLFENGFCVQEKLMTVAFEFTTDKKLKRIFFKVNRHRSFFRRYLQKWLNIQFTDRENNIGQLFHENVLVPMAFFFSALAPVHASAVTQNKKSFALGGTGGVGKTSLELHLCLHKKARFLADDITFISNKGLVYPNYNYPKIYSYNLDGKRHLKKILFKKTSCINRIHWVFYKKIFGRVRRKVSPFVLYPQVEENARPLDSYFILVKGITEQLTFKKCLPQEAVERSIEIMMTEYAYFFNHLYWHQYNCGVAGLEPFISIDVLKNKWRNVLKEAFENKTIYNIHIPAKMNHDTFLKELENKVLN